MFFYVFKMAGAIAFFKISSISMILNFRKQTQAKGLVFMENMHQSMSINGESSMLQSPPKYLYYVEHHFSFTVLTITIQHSKSSSLI